MTANYAPMTTQEHWNKVYAAKEPSQLGWFEEVPEPSLKLLAKCGLRKDEAILVAGAGASTFVDALVEREYNNVTAADISEIALGKLKQRLGTDKSRRVKWIVDDLTNPAELVRLQPFALWHDRAVLHFLLTESERSQYLRTLNALVRQGGYVMIALFSPEGAKKCSGLDIRNYDRDMLAEFLGKEWKLLDTFDYTHTNPTGDPRPYVYTLFQRA